MVAKSAVNLKKAAAEIQEISPTRLAYLSQDLVSPSALRNIAAFAKKNKKELHNLFLNAGTYLEGSLKSGSRGAFEKQMELNFYSIFGLVQMLLPLLDRSKPCRIVLTGSTAGLEASSDVPLYGITKWALRGYAVNLRKELMKEKIAVTYVAPGGTYTDLWKPFPEVKENRLMAPEDVAKMVAAVLSLSGRCDVEQIIMRPMLGDVH